MTFTMPANPLKPQEIEALLLNEATKQNSKNIGKYILNRHLFSR
jgi:hypothetical protein